MKKSKLKLVLKKEVINTLNSSEGRSIMGGVMASGQMMCVPTPPPDTKGDCPSATKFNICATQVIC